MLLPRTALTLLTLAVLSLPAPVLAGGHNRNSGDPGDGNGKNSLAGNGSNGIVGDNPNATDPAPGCFRGYRRGTVICPDDPAMSSQPYESLARPVY
ncbi:MAG TPA: hypothetical protein VL418_07955 [Devosiaceae bacterium]|nr:hypothetical protein [Devosiaceae bacterium]